MSDHHMTMTADGSSDDLPRTIRREREARDREARERSFQMPSASSIMGEEHHYPQTTSSYPGDAQPAVVRRFDVPFVHLVMFFTKCVFAAIPAILLLTILLWVGGQIVQTYFPQLIKAHIQITLFPH